MQFSDREKAFEDKFAHDEEMQFKVRAKRNKEVGLWAAKLMNLSGEKAHEYADNLVIQMLDKQALMERLRSDLSKAKTKISDVDLFTQIDNFAISARKYFMEASK